MNDIVEIHSGVVMEKLRDLVELTRNYRDSEIASPFRQLDDAIRIDLLYPIKEWVHSEASHLQLQFDLIRLLHKHALLHDALLQL